jgi:drug/metabolite transporter (DMT)-like permease
MNEQSQTPESEPLSRREARRQRREQRLADPSRGDAWIIGIILIVLGGLFLMRTMGADVPLTNWWALFILIPAFGALSAAWRMYRQADHRLTTAARSSLLVGLALSFITFMFLFEISWTYVGPILIIVVGIAIILNYVIGSQD